MQKNKLMRDAFIDEVYKAALNDKDIIFISADFGAAALDDFRKNLPEQFIHAGISEQNMVDVGVGLALTGKKVFLYAMAPFITTRCYEQVKAVVSSMQLPITLIAVATGIANNIPITPPTRAPISSAVILRIGFRPTAFCMTFGTNRLFSIC